MNIRQMTDVEKRSAAKTFVETWLGRGDEKQDAQNFWRQLLQTVYGVESPESDVLFEYPIKKDVKSSTIFIDAYIKDTAVLIEQKGKDINLRKHYEQSDGSKLTPYGQARRYAGLLPHNMNPRWIVVSNFQEFHIHDMNNPNGEPYVVLLKDLEKEYTRLNFLVDTGSENLRREMEISKKAGDLVGLLYEALLKETENIIHMKLGFLPLKTQANIVEGNALRLDWESVVDKSRLNYIMGNPPFGGHQQRSPEQTNDMAVAFYDLPKHGKLDFVCAWYAKAAEYMHATPIACAFVSTNSICQGESVSILWKYMFESKGADITFAYQSFQWASESNDAAAVSCVIIGFTVGECIQQKKLFQSNGQIIICEHINGYLFDNDNIYIQSRGKPLTTGMPIMSKGSQPTDSGNLILSSEEKNALIQAHPVCANLIKRYISADDYIYDRYRYCLWLKGVSPAEYNKIPEITRRLQKVAEARAKSPTASVRKDADIPMLFTQIRQPDTDYLAVPEVSSEKRIYPYWLYGPGCYCQQHAVPYSQCRLVYVRCTNIEPAYGMDENCCWKVGASV